MTKTKINDNNLKGQAEYKAGDWFDIRLSSNSDKPLYCILTQLAPSRVGLINIDSNEANRMHDDESDLVTVENIYSITQTEISKIMEGYASWVQIPEVTISFG